MAAVSTKSSEERFFDLSVDLLCTVDAASGRLLTVNRAWEETLGWSAADLRGREFVDFVHPEDLPTTLTAAAGLRASEQRLTQFENRWRSAEGSHRRLLWSVREHGGVWYCVGKDVTDAHERAAQRRRDAELARAVASSMADGVYVVGSTGAVVYANPAALRVLGYEASELVGRNAHATLHHKRADGTPFPAEECPVIAGRKRGEAVESDADWLCRKDGSMVAVAYSASPIPLADGTGNAVVFRDITRQQAVEAARQEAEGQLRRSEELHRTLVAHLPDTTVFLLDTELRVLLADGEAARRLPWFEENMFRGRKVTELYGEIPADVLSVVLDNYRAAFAGERRAFEVDSEGLIFAVQAVPVRGESGGVEAALVVATDVTERKQAERMLDRRARQQRAAAEFGQFALKSHDMAAVVDQALRTATGTLGADFGTVLALDDDERSLTVTAGVGLPEHLIGRRVPLAESANADHTMRSREPLIVRDLASETRFAPPPLLLDLGVSSTLSVAITVHDRPYGVLNIHTCDRAAFTVDDASFLSSVATLVAVAIERHREEDATRHAALHDALSGLPNRTLALDRLTHALARRRRDGIDVAVLLLDLDRFKILNDSAGHAAGDEVLVALAPRLTAAVRPTDTVARLGGDEFVVVCPDVDARGAIEVAERLAAAVNRPLVLDSGEHFFTASIGIAVAATSSDGADSLLRDADTALYRAKERGRGRYELFDDTMRAGVMKRVRTETELRRALDRDQIEVWYQPVVDVESRRPVGTEAFVRWQHPERGVIAPLEFLSIAEETGLIGEIGLRVLEQACRQTAVWQQKIDPDLTVSINVSPREAANPLFPAEVAGAARRSGMRPGTLVLEITESLLAQEAGAPATVLDTLHHHGLAVALDDFGTGYSSLSRLKRLPLDTLKIDRSFVDGIARDADDRAIVKAAIDMAHAVGLSVVAEGVETEDQGECLRTLGCELAQGYLYGRPQPAQALADVLVSLRRSSISRQAAHDGAGVPSAEYSGGRAEHARARGTER